MDNRKIWMDGKIVGWDEANVHVMTHTLHYGLGVFEGIRCYKTVNGSAGFRFNEHIKKIFYPAPIISIKIAFLGSNKLGLNCKGANVHTAVVIWQWGAYLGEEGLTKGIRAKVSSFTRHHININMTKAKVCGNYVNSILAKLEVTENGYDEAILLDVNGDIKTPPINSVLEGITRDSIERIANDSGIKVKEESFSRDELYIADEAFFCGTAPEINPII